MPENRIIRVFLASPGDLAIERRAFKDTIDELNRGFGRGADVQFAPLGWEDALSQVGRRSQAVINQDVDVCDVFLLIMWRRWGQSAPDAAPFSSYTEEEFYRALARFEKTRAPTIFVFFKYIDSGQMADPGPQLAKVLEFRRTLERTQTVLYREFKDEVAFRLEVDRHLIAYAKAEGTSSGDSACIPVIPESISFEIERYKSEARNAIQELEKLRVETKRAVADAERARAEAKTASERAEAAEQLADANAEQRLIELAERASKAAAEGRIEEARQGFSKALDGTAKAGALYLGFDFFRRIGDLDEAERLLQRWLSINGRDHESPKTADAYGNLGNIERARGNLKAAEEYLKKSLAINEKLGIQDGIASAYGNLGLIERVRGNLGTAEEYLKKSLAINERIGSPEGVASVYGNLGVIAEQRGHVSQASHHWTLSRDLFKKLGAKDRGALIQSWLDSLPPEPPAGPSPRKK